MTHQPEANQPIDKKQYEASMARLYDIFKDVSGTATEVSTWRCPYKNAKNRCTANFGCRNQLRTVPKDELFICTASDKLDYRDAWEV